MIQDRKVQEESDPDISNISHTISCEKGTIIGEFPFIIISKNLRNHFNKIIVFYCIEVFTCFFGRFTAFFESERYLSRNADCIGSITEVGIRCFFISGARNTVSDFFEIIKFDRFDPKFSVGIRPDGIIVRPVKEPATNSNVQ